MTQHEIKAANPADWANARRGAPARYPWDSLEVGQLFTVGSEQETGTKFSSLRCYVSTKGKELGKSFRCRQLPDGTREVVRIA